MIPNSYFDRFSTPKYCNPGRLHRELIRRFVERLHSLFIAAHPLDSVLEIGCGQGFLLGYLSEKFPRVRFVGIDPNQQDLQMLRAEFDGIETHEGSIYDLDFLAPDAPAAEGSFDLIVCAEVLEHLEAPDRALEQMLRLRPKHLLLTVPHEPLFRISNFLRGKNITRLGNDIEHINHWGQRSFKAMLQPRFEVLQLTTSYPWLLALVAPK